MRALREPEAILAVASLASLAFYIVVLLGSAIFQLDGDWFLVLGDDAMISMRYARNLAAGEGLYWNEGGSPAGYSNLLWTLWMALGHRLLGPGVGAAAFVIASAFVLHLASGWAIYRVLVAAGCDRTRAAMGAAVFLVALQPLQWSSYGFETALMIAVTTWGALALLHDRALVAAAVFCVGVLVRDDFLVVAFVLAVASGAGPRLDQVRRAALVVLPPLVCLGLLCAWRDWYYGDPLPNTYYLKATGWPLDARLAAGFRYIVPLLPATACALAVLGWRRSRSDSWRRVALMFGALLVAEVIYSAWPGGDAFPGSRLALPAWPAFGLAFAALPPIRTRRATLGQVAVALLFVATPATDSLGSLYRRSLGLIDDATGGEGVPPRYSSGDIGPRTPVEILNVAACHAVQRDAQHRGLRRPSMAVYYAGTPPYFCPEFVAIDLLGKSDRHVARLPAGQGRAGHNKWDYEYSLGELRPDYLVTLLPSVEAIRDPSYAARPEGEYNWHHLVRSEAFLRRYADSPIDWRGPPVFRRGMERSPGVSASGPDGPWQAKRPQLRPAALRHNPLPQ